MRKLIFATIVALGAIVGFVSMIEHDWFTRIGMMLVGIVVALPFAGLSFTGVRRQARRRKASSLFFEREPPREGTSPEELVANYWRDKGHAPFMNPADAVPDSNVNEKY